MNALFLEHNKYIKHNTGVQKSPNHLKTEQFSNQTALNQSKSKMFDIQARLQISAHRGEGSDLSYDLKANPSSMLQRQGEALKVVICLVLEAIQMQIPSTLRTSWKFFLKKASPPSLFFIRSPLHWKSL